MNAAATTKPVASKKGSSFGKLLKQSDVMMAIALVGIVVVMIIPIPAFLLDIALACSISLSLAVLLTALYVEEPLKFSVFPGLLLVVTLFRLALNIASTRLILGEGDAGAIITAFGNFVVGGNYFVGLVIFIVLVIINLIVITKGSGRIAEVAARFTLDAMPGKQMAIDADLNQGMIDEVEARKRREKISREADFYGAMDGASKFVRGDAVAGLLITAINIIGGFAVGMVQMGMSWQDSASSFTILTVGDGLVSQIPALLISVASGIIVTRAATEGNLGSDITSQLLGYPRALFISSGVLALFAVTPGLPALPFFVLSASTFALARVSSAKQKDAAEKHDGDKLPVPKPQDRLEDYVLVDPLEVQIGYGLIPLVEGGPGGDLLDRITVLRKQMAGDSGFVIPPVRIRDNTQLAPNLYIIRIRGSEAGRGEVRPGMLMALSGGEGGMKIEGIPTRDPSFGLPAIWITREQKELAQSRGYTVVEAAAVVSTHLSELLKVEGYRLMSRELVQELLDAVKRTHKALIEELIPGQLGVGQVQKVLQNLLREGLPIRDMATILETLADYAPMTKDPDYLTEAVRSSLAKVIAEKYEDEPGNLSALTMEPKLEQMISDGLRTAAKEGSEFTLPSAVTQRLIATLKQLAQGMLNRGFQPIVITAPGTRGFLKKLLEVDQPSLIVLSTAELPPSTKIQPMGIVKIEG